MKTFNIEVGTQREDTKFKLEVNEKTFNYFRELTKGNHYLFDEVMMYAIAKNYKENQKIFPELIKASADGLDNLVQLISGKHVVNLSGDMINIVFSHDKENVARYKFRIQNFNLISEEFDFFSIYQSRIF